MPNHPSPKYKHPASHCRHDEVFKQEYHQRIQHFYRYTDGIFNCQYVGKIFRVSAKYARQVILQCPYCAEINTRRRYRRKFEGIKRSILAQAVVSIWGKDPDNTFIDDLALMFNIPVTTAQTMLNKRDGAEEFEHKLKRPLSFTTDSEFYLRNEWKDADGYWQKPKKIVGWRLQAEHCKKSRTYYEFPWPESDEQWIEAVEAYAKGMSMNRVMIKYKIPSQNEFNRFIAMYNKKKLQK